MAQELNISLNGSMLRLSDPKSDYSIVVPSDINGLRIIKEMLRARNGDPSGKLGTNAKPTQQMIEAFLRSVELEKENVKKEDRLEIARIF